MAASNYMLPPPPVLEIHDQLAAEKWKKFKRAWNNYSLATELNKKSEAVQVATLLTVIGEEAREVFSTFSDWAAEGDESKIAPVLAKFEAYCQPRKNVPFERYRFNRRVQEPGETYDQYRTALRKIADGCEFDTITPDQILRDKLVFGIRDGKARERLLRESNLTLQKTDEICHAAESMLAQVKVVDDSLGSTVNAIKSDSNPQPKPTKDGKNLRECWNCGRRHELHKRELCPAYGKTCNKCHKQNHFAAKCRSKAAPQAVKAVEDDEVYQARITSSGADDSQLVTLRLENGNYLRFQADTGAQCNVVPLDLYKKATRDYKLKQVTLAKQRITAYGGTSIPVVGQTLLRVWRGDFRCRLDCRIVDVPNLRPLLGRKACIGMNIVTYLDNDQLNKPNTGDAEVYPVSEKVGALTKEQLMRKYPRVFGDGIGRLKGEYHIRLDPQSVPVQHAPRKVPVALRDRLKETLDQLSEQGIVAPVTEPTSWVSSMVVVPKSDGKLRICLDPKDLNQAIQREHYPLPTIEDIATRLHGAKVFTVLDVRNGFWHVPLDEDSSFLTTFNTPFGRYRWTRMPFGISSAPEVFQRRMHEVIEGLKGVEVVADDFVAVGFGDTDEEAIANHDETLEAFLRRCEESDLKLNDTKLKLRQQEVPFIGHIATAEGLCVDPHKVRAIQDMPPPQDVTAVQRILGLAQYLSKFLPHLSDITKPLRELTQQDTEWVWGPEQAAALQRLKTAVSSTPVLRYYNVKEEVTLQCDASQTGLGASLLQNGQPVAYASRALTDTETRYAQIEKELLAIVFACTHFESYVYGRDVVQVETDHQPLVSIVLKPLNSAPSRLQRMLLRLQKYSLNVKYKRGKEMFLADTLSRAHPPEVHACEFSRQLETVDHTDLLTMPAEQLHRFKHVSSDDPVLRVLRETILRGWPNSKSEVPESVHAYYDIRDELTIQDDLVFKGQQVVVPSALRKEMIQACHASHIGIEGCIRRARESVYWPRMSTELREYISKCDVCMAHRTAPSKEPIQQHEFAARPWNKVGADLCDFYGRTLLVVSDYYSNFIEVENVTRANTNGVAKALKAMFARYGVPDILISDNGPQFSSSEFATFAKKWGFEHITSSPHYPQSNGKAENAVKTVKRLFTKCRDTGQSEFLALLDWRNTPSEGIGTSPSQRFLGRRCRTLLPISGSLLQPRYPVEEDARAINNQKERQQQYYDQHVKPLKPLKTGEAVRVRLPGKKTWSPAICSGMVGPRSYEVATGEQVLIRNRRHLIQSGEQPELDLPDSEVEGHDEQNEQDSTNVDITETKPIATPDKSPVLRRSLRNRKSPDWFTKYAKM